MDKKFEKLQKEFEQYKKESVKWSYRDFTLLKKKGWKISKAQAQLALEKMIAQHDCTIGITWDTVDFYYEEFGEKIEK